MAQPSRPGIRTSGRVLEATAATLPTTHPRYLDVDAAAEYLGVSVSFIRRLVLERRVRYYKLGKYLRFDPADLDALVAKTRVDPVPSQYNPLRGRLLPVSPGSRRRV
jgi:excisionase family DNA binding protein